MKDDVITFVEGAPESTFTHGTPCVKGLSYPRRVYSPDRIKYPMVQDVRGSGNWRRISGRSNAAHCYQDAGDQKERRFNAGSGDDQIFRQIWGIELCG